MIDLFDLYNQLNSEVNSYQGGFIRPQMDFERQVNAISLKFWNDLTEQADKTNEIQDELNPFRRSVNLIVSPTSNGFGKMSYPKGYGRYSSARILVAGEETFPDTDLQTCDCNGKAIDPNERKESEFEKEARIEKYKDSITEVPIWKIANGKWGSILQHKTKKPTLSVPAITQYDEGFKVAPRNVSVIVLDYYILPEPAVFAYTISPGNTITGQGDTIIYNKESSKPLQWSESMIPRFLNELKLKYGIYTRDQLMIQASQIK